MRMPRGGSLVSASPDGSPLARSTCYKRGLAMPLSRNPEGEFVDLRYTPVMLAISGVVPIQLFSKMLGHSTPGFTYNVYAHADASGTAAIADRINARFVPWFAL